MGAFIDLTGQKFDRLTVLSRDPLHKGKGKNAKWLCRCICGNEKIISSINLRTEITRSCGCIKREQTIERNQSHGRSKTREYFTWQGMKDRCFNPNCDKFEHYGGRGITVCDRWKNSFENFLEDMGERPSPNHTIDRINNDGNYEPGNCRWVTQKVQMRNMRKSRFAYFEGKEFHIVELAEKTGLSYDQIRRWSIEKYDLTEKIHSYFSRNSFIE